MRLCACICADCQGPPDRTVKRFCHDIPAVSCFRRTGSPQTGHWPRPPQSEGRDCTVKFVREPHRSPSGFTGVVGRGTGSPGRRPETLNQKIDEGPHLGSLMTARRQQRVQRVGFRILCVLQQGFQQSLMYGARNHMLAQPHDASSSHCQLQQHTRAVGADRTFDIDPTQLAVHSKRPARRAGISAQDQARMTSEIGRFGRPAVMGEVAWACANDPSEIDDLARDEPRVLERAHPQGDVDVFTDEDQQCDWSP
jgi:hypothetical protein